MDEIPETVLLIQPYSLKELAARYRCPMKTFKRWLHQMPKDLGPRIGRYYNPRQVRIIVEQLGEP